MGETVGYNLSAVIKGGVLKEFQPVFSGTLGSLGRKDAIGTIGASGLKLKGTPAALMKEASNIRYLSQSGACSPWLIDHTLITGLHGVNAIAGLLVHKRQGTTVVSGAGAWL